MAGIFDSIKKAFTTNPLDQASKTGDNTTPAATPYKAPTEDPASMLKRNTAAAEQNTAAQEAARKKRAAASRMTADGVAKQLQSNVQ